MKILRLCSVGLWFGFSWVQAAEVFDPVYLQHLLADWKILESKTPHPTTVVRMIPKDQHKFNWKQMIWYGQVTPQQLQVDHLDAMAFAMIFHKRLKQLCRGAQWQTLVVQPNDVVIAWQVQGCGSGVLEDQLEIVRFVATPDCIYHIHYLKKGNYVSVQDKTAMQNLVLSPGLFKKEDELKS